MYFKQKKKIKNKKKLNSKLIFKKCNLKNKKKKK